jgi:transcriptional regulator of heat shock response
MPKAAFAASGLAFFCSGVFCEMSKEDRIIENMTERHNSNLDKMEDKMNEYIEMRELEMSKARTDETKKKIQARIDKYVNWYEEMVQQAEDSFQDRLERRLKTRRENM